MKNIINLQGQILTPDCVNVIRALLVDDIMTTTRLSVHPQPDGLFDAFTDGRRRAFHLLDALDGARYVLDDKESEIFTILIHGKMLSDYDAMLLATSLERAFKSPASDAVLKITGFSAAHFKNLVSEMADKVLPLIPKDDEDDEPIPE